MRQAADRSRGPTPCAAQSSTWTGGQGPATIYVNTDADGLGAGGFGARVTVTTTNVGGFDFIPAQSGRSVDAPLVRV